MAEQTLARIPAGSLQQFLARADVPIGMREFFADRGFFPDEIPAIEAEVPAEADEPLIDLGESEAADDPRGGGGIGASKTHEDEFH